nr:hypothetical protein [Tanacetum cinerariifolium]
MTALLNDLSYIPPNNEHNEPTQGDIVETKHKKKLLLDDFKSINITLHTPPPPALPPPNPPPPPLLTTEPTATTTTRPPDGQSTEVDVPPDIIIDVVDEDDDITDDENALPHDLAESDNEDLINVDDDGVDNVY